MNELVQMVQQKTGLSQDMAQKVVDTVVGYLKTKLPAPLCSGLDEFMGSGAGDASSDAPVPRTKRAGSWERPSPWSPISLRSRVPRIANSDRQSQDGEANT